MNTYDRGFFKEQIKDFSKEQCVEFAKICAIRALPFLGAYGNFDFWKKEAVQKHLYSIFFGIDFVFTYTIDKELFNNIRFNSCSPVRAANNINISRDIYTYNYAYDSVSAIYFATITATEATHSNFSNVDVCRSANAYYDAHTFASLSSGAMKKLLLTDIECIEEDVASYKVNLNIYGKIWDNFIAALNNCGCEYWANLYTRLFNNGFVFDEEELKKRVQVPPDISVDGASAVGSYMKRILEGDSEKIKEARVFIVGGAGAGKTSLVHRLCNEPLPATDDFTFGFEVNEKEYDEINTSFWDFGGQIIFYSAHRIFMSDNSTYIIVCNGRTEDEYNIEKEFELVKTFGENSKVFVVVNQHFESPVYFDEKYYNNEYSECEPKLFVLNLKTGKIKNFETALEKHLRVGTKTGMYPFSYINAKRKINYEFKKEQSTAIPIDYLFENFAPQYKEYSDKESLLKYLQSSGTVIISNDKLFNPEWLSKTIYTTIYRMYEKHFETLTIKRLSEIFTDSDNIPTEDFEYIIKVMVNFGLGCYTDSIETEIIVPEALPYISSNDEEIYYDLQNTTENFSFKIDTSKFIPDNLMPRFITKLYESIKDRHYFKKWKNACLYRDTEKTILVFKKPTNSNVIDFRVHSEQDDLNKILGIFIATCNDYEFNIESKDIKIYRENTEFPLDGIKDKGKSELSVIEAILQQFCATGGILMSNTTIHIHNGNETKIGDIHGGKNAIGGTFNDYSNNYNFGEQYQKDRKALLKPLSLIANELKTNGDEKEYKQIKKLLNLLEETKECDSIEDADDKGIVETANDLVEQLGNENSSLHKKVAGIEKLHDIVSKAAPIVIPVLGNIVSAFLGLPQVPVTTL
jgi:GTPase SAR1 family protein